MATSLTPEDKASFTRIIDGILSTSDLQTVSRKKIRQGLETAVGKDLAEFKDAIKKLIEERFDAISSADAAIPTPPPAPASTNGHSHDADDADADADADPDADADGEGEIEVSTTLPPKKKMKRESSSEDADARLAAELQAEENRLSRSRSTRGGGTTATKKKVKKTPKKKSEKRVRSEDDSEVDSDLSGEKTKRKAAGGFQKPFNLSYALQEVTGETQLSRPQVVKKLWDHIKANELQDPKDKRQILCDEKLQAVFKINKVSMFQMNKLLGSHLYPVEGED